MKQYLDILGKIITSGKTKTSRPGVDCKSVTGAMFEHDMCDGFPLLTTKFVSLKTVAVELEGFIKGVTSKSWFQERNCHIWDDWCNPQKVPYANDEETKKKMKEEDDLGLIYGSQWANFKDPSSPTQGINQLQKIIDTLKTNPFDRRMICMAWNPLALEHQALPPCHYSWQVVSDGVRLDLIWNQRSCDVPIGLPYNIASYALLLKLLAREVNMKEGKLIGFLSDCHIYESHIEQVSTILTRTPMKLCNVDILNFNSIYDWCYDDIIVSNYTNSGVVKMKVVV